MVERVSGQERLGLGASVSNLRFGLFGATMLLAYVLVVVFFTTRANGGFSYPLDDTYIHLRLAENLSNGTLGINPGEFAAASSSLLWSGILAVAVKPFGPIVGIPLAITTLASAAILISLDLWSRHRSWTTGQRMLLQLGMILCVPLPLVAWIGMEHVLQIALALTIANMTELATRNEAPTRAADTQLLALCLFGTLGRLELLFVVIPACLLLVLHHRYRQAAAAFGGAAVGLCVIVAMNLSQGWPAAPTSVIAKSSLKKDGLLPLLPTPNLSAILGTNRLLLVVILVLGLWSTARLLGLGWRTEGSTWSLIFLGAFIFHVSYAELGWLGRYEAYLVALGVVAALLSMREVASSATPRLAILLRAAPVVAFLFMALSGVSLSQSAIAGTGVILNQQVQMAHFASNACQECDIAANDIGALSLYSGATITDIVGLANKDILRVKQDGVFDTEALDRATADSQMAIVYPDKIEWVPGIPASWDLLGYWVYPDQATTGGNRVAFFSLDASRTKVLQAEFDQFQPTGAHRLG